MRILLFSGKGGVGKTSLAAATGLQLSRLGYRTLVMSVDPAHSLADAFDLEVSLFNTKTGDPYPIADRLPTDSYFANIQELFGKLDGIGDLLEDPKITSVRLVTNPERMVLRETQRAFVYFSLHGLTVDGIIVNRVLPTEVTDSFFQEWRNSQSKILEEIEAYFAPVAVTRIPLFTHEVVGRER